MSDVVTPGGVVTQQPQCSEQVGAPTPERGKREGEGVVATVAQVLPQPSPAAMGLGELTNEMGEVSPPQQRQVTVVMNPSGQIRARGK